MASTDLLQGTLDVLILKSLALQRDHGLGIARRVEQITNGAFVVRPGSLFPALHRLEARGWLKPEWGESENRRKAKFYTLAASGRRQLKLKTREWERVATAMARALAT